jgi:hypothetical protein
MNKSPTALQLAPRMHPKTPDGGGGGRAKQAPPSIRRRGLFRAEFRALATPADGRVSGGNGPMLALQRALAGPGEASARKKSRVSAARSAGGMVCPERLGPWRFGAGVEHGGLPACSRCDGTGRVAR